MNRFDRLRMLGFAGLAIWFGGAGVRAGMVDVSVALGADGHDMVHDAARGLLYVSVPSTNEVVFVSTSSYEIVDQVNVGAPPRGLALSLDGDELYVALNQTGSVGFLDLESLELTTLDIEAELGDDRTWDVLEAAPDRLFVTANPGSSGFAWVVMVELDAGLAASRVADNDIIRAAPLLEGSADQTALYVGEGFSPNSLYKLDLTQPDAPLILEDDHGSISGTSYLEVSPDGDEIFLRSGQVLSTATFDQVGMIAGGPAEHGDDASVVYVAQTPGTILEYSTDTLTQNDSFTVPCSLGSIARFLVLPDDGGFLLLGGSAVCGLAVDSVAGDCDGDGDVDLADFGGFQLCFTGPGGTASGDCGCADFDGDGDVDLSDFNAFQLAFTGPGA